MFDSVKKFISHWYFRYLLVTELYMVESWERVMIYIVFLIFFTALSLFNSYVVLSGVGLISGSKLNWASLSPLEGIPTIQHSI